MTLIPVSILILLDSILLLKPSIEEDEDDMLFQSLFYWILFFYTQIYIDSDEKSAVSILILLDSILLFCSIIEYNEDYTTVSILILLDSILLSVLHRRLFIFNSYRVFLRI